MSNKVKIAKDQITPELLRIFFDYDAETGDVTWRYVSPEMQHQIQDAYGFKRKIGNVAGKPAFTSINKTHRYYQGGLAGRVLLKHIVCYALYHGVMPTSDIDHLDHDRLNCKISNLRMVTKKQNSQNMGKRKNESKYGANLVRVKKGLAYYVQLRVKGKQIRINVGRDLAQAQLKRDEIIKEYGYSANHNK